MKVAFLGDIALLGAYSIYNNHQLVGSDIFSEVRSLLKGCYVVGNLESPFSFKKKRFGAKSIYLYSEPENVEILKMIGVNAVTIANNHTFDYGKEGYELTKRILDEFGIEWFGAEGKELKIENEDCRLAFSGWCCYSTNPQGCVPWGEYGINEFDLSTVINRLKENDNSGWLNIAAVHSGIEHVNYPSIDLRKAAKMMADAVPLLFYGHHPHVVQPIERIGNSIIAYSMGNFMFDDTFLKPTDSKPLVKLSENNRSSFIMKVEIENNTLKGYEILPIYIGHDKIHVDKGVNETVLSDYLQTMNSMNEDEYEDMRRRQRLEWIAPRHAQRDFVWYIQRLRPRYARLVFNNKINEMKYQKHVKEQLCKY